MKFSFQIDSIIVNLYTAPNEGLASFGMYVLSLKGHKLVDESLSTSIVLCDIQLDDIRPNRENKLTRFMNRRETKNSDNSIDVDSVVRSMLDIVFNQSKDDMFGKLFFFLLFILNNFFFYLNLLQLKLKFPDLI